MICCAASRSVPVRRERCAVEGGGVWALVVVEQVVHAPLT